MLKAIFLCKVVFLFCFAVYPGAPSTAQSFIIDGTVVEVFDGETIIVRNRRKIRHTVRLASIDAPLMSQPFGEQARQYLSDLILGKTVKARGRRFDDDGRLRGKVLLGGRDVNLEMIIAGLAMHHIEINGEETERDRQLYESAEFHARRSRFNIWSGAAPASAATTASPKEPALPFTGNNNQPPR